MGRSSNEQNCILRVYIQKNLILLNFNRTSFPQLPIRLLRKENEIPIRFHILRAHFVSCVDKQDRARSFQKLNQTNGTIVGFYMLLAAYFLGMIQGW